MTEKSKKASGNGAENKTEDRKIELEEITKPFGPFVSRMSDREVKLGDTTFVLRRLLADAYEYIHAKAARPDGLQDNIIRMNLFVTIGIVDIKNAFDMDGNPITFKKEVVVVNTKDYSVYGEDLIAAMPVDVLLHLYNQVQDITNLSEAEVKKLDFILPLPDQE